MPIWRAEAPGRGDIRARSFVSVPPRLPRTKFGCPYGCSKLRIARRSPDILLGTSSGVEGAPRGTSVSCPRQIWPRNRRQGRVLMPWVVRIPEVFVQPSLQQLKTTRFVLARMRERVVRCIPHSQNRKAQPPLPLARLIVPRSERSPRPVRCVNTLRRRRYGNDPRSNAGYPAPVREEIASQPQARPSTPSECGRSFGHARLRLRMATGLAPAGSSVARRLPPESCFRIAGSAVGGWSPVSGVWRCLR